MQPWAYRCICLGWSIPPLTPPELDFLTHLSSEPPVELDVLADEDLPTASGCE